MRITTIKKVAFLALFALILAACESDPEEPEQRDDFFTGMSFEVDESLSPSLEALGERRLVGLVDETGTQLDFVAEELLFVGDEGLDDFLDRWDGDLIETTDLSELDEDLEPIHQVAVDPSQGNADSLSELFEQFDEKLFAEFVATDEDALGLLAIAMEERVHHDNHVVINPYFPSQDDPRMAYIDQTLEAAENGDDDLVSGSYDRNPSRWFHYNSGSTQDIGVTDAWRALAMAGLTDPEDPDDRVRIAILDGGFLDLDLPEGSNSAVFGSPNPGGCGGGTLCPWHGTAVAHVAVGDPHSGEGVIGTGGPVATATMIGVSGDLKSLLQEVVKGTFLAVDGSTRIINMSFGGNIHWTVNAAFGLSKLVGGFFRTLRAVGNILSFASAGNNGEFINAMSCNPFGSSCWDTHKFLPCQAGGVVCVGGLDDDSRDRHSSSNYGWDVDIWAPYRNYAGIDPLQPSPDTSLEKAHVRGGTSYSSPYVAGVAALVMAADPDLSAREVRDLLLSTTRDGQGRAYNYIQARTAVYEALGGAPFSLTFWRPDEGEVFERGDLINAQVIAAGSDFPTEIEWELDGEPLGTGSLVTFSRDETLEMELGTYELTVSVTAGPYELSRTRTFELINSPPSISIQSPQEALTYYEGSTILLRAGSSNRESPGGVLDDSQVIWTVESTGAQVATGHHTTITGSDLGVGTWTLVVTGDDGMETATDEVTITIEENPDVLPPDATIVQPQEHDSGVLGWRAEWHLDFEGYAWHDGDELTGSALQWYTTYDINQNDPDEPAEYVTEYLGEGNEFNAELYIEVSCWSQQDHLIEMTATEPDGISRTVSVEITLGGPTC